MTASRELLKISDNERRLYEVLVDGPQPCGYKANGWTGEAPACLPPPTI